MPPTPTPRMLSFIATSYAGAQPRVTGPGNDFTGLRRLDLAEGAFPPSPAVLRALLSVRRSALSELPDREAKRLRGAIANFLGVTLENVAVFSGTDEIIDLIPRTYLNLGDVALAVVPTFGRLVRTSEKVGARVALHALREDRDFTLGPDEAAGIAEDVVRAGARIVWLCSPGNPTGRVIATEVVGLLAGQLPDVKFIVDEAYQEYESLDPRRSSVSLIAKYANVIVLRTFSKAFGLAGVRIGYAVAAEQTCAEIATLRIAFSTSRVGQELAVAALGDLGYTQRLVASVGTERQRLERVLDANGALAYVGGSVSNILLVRHRHADLHAILARHGIASLDLQGSPGLAGANYVRISIGRQDDNRHLRHVIRSLS